MDIWLLVSGKCNKFEKSNSLEMKEDDAWVLKRDNFSQNSV